MPMDPGKITSSIQLPGPGDSTLLLQHLVRIQAEFNYIPDKAVADLSSSLGIPAAEIRGVIDFYSFLHLTPRGKYDILFSDSITDHMLGSRELITDLTEKLGVTVGEVRGDGRVSVDTTSCTGMCEQGPALLVNRLAINHLDQQRIEQIARLIEEDVDLADWPKEFFQIDDSIQRQDILLSSMASATGASPDTLTTLLSPEPDNVLDILQDAGLRGRGGAGFMTAIKWRSCRDTAAEQRYVVCNADEGEPGTFKDRVLLQRYAHQLIEGMTLCAHTINASKGYIYLRGEYLYLLEHLQAVLQERRDLGLLANNISGKAGFDFDIDIHLGAGAYICGEESALIESLEGKRGIPRKRPPFPVTHGYKNQPTVVNNVETFIAASQIILHGAEWFKGAGTEQSSGTKLLSISGDCERPGIYEYAFGTSIRQVLGDCGAHDTLAVQIAGAAGVTIPSEQFDRSIAFEDISTGGSFIIFNSDRNLLDMVQNFTHFFAHESCGFCTPCRVGSSLLKDLIDKLHAGHAGHYDINELNRITIIMRDTSFCGLGATAPNPVIQTLTNFPEIYERQVQHTDYEPAFDLDAALEEARQVTHCFGPEAHIKS
ncbi:MAG: NAD(P)H-dependent oxidoreductase subunit E [Gammaproteobacteria bacterium]|nr:NAD(P)H-dependent oxidoreductase subunit E [Gammaproteobacteria bacterium]